MTKEELQKELQEKVKEGVRPSDIKRLKRSKSTNDIQYPLPNNSELTNLQTENEALKKQIQELAKKKVLVDAPEESLAELKQKINELEKQLDQANESRLKALKDFDQQQEKIKQLEKELESTAEYGANQITNLEKINRELKRERSSLVEQLKLTKQDLENFQRINELRLQKQDLTANPEENWWDQCGPLILTLALAVSIILLSKNKHD